MGNRGTTPSWDEEEIAKYGLFEHIHFTNTRRRAAERRGREKRDKERSKLLSVLRQVLAKNQEE